MKIVRNILKQGFSLIELLVVVAIIGILAAIGSVGYTRYIKISQDRVHLANLVELMDGLAVTYTGLMSNQIKSDDPLYSNCHDSLFSTSGWGLTSTLTSSPWAPWYSQDCMGYLSNSFKSPYNNKDKGGINGTYVVTPCVYDSGQLCSDLQQISNSFDGPVPENLNLSSDGYFLYSDNTPVNTLGKIVYYDTGPNPGGCRVIYLAACHSDGTSEDDGMLIINPPCTDPDGDWSSHNPPLPEEIVSHVRDYNAIQATLRWTGAKIIKTIN